MPTAKNRLQSSLLTFVGVYHVSALNATRAKHKAVITVSQSIQIIYLSKGSNMYLNVVAG